MILLEACIASVEDAVAAERGGADRLELNSALELDGLTPSPGLYKAVQEAVSLPVIVMIRPRSYGFHYSDAEFRIMQTDIEVLMALGADGIAIGFLNEDFTIDAARVSAVRRQIGDRELVFHRAFDITPNPETALEQLIACGVDRVLTSGHHPIALDGISQIASLVEQARGRIEILPGSGINPSNAAVILHQTGCTQLHGTFRRPVVHARSLAGLDRLLASPPDGVDVDVVSAVRTAVDGV